MCIKDSIAIACATADSREPLRFLGTTRYSLISLTKALGKIDTPIELSICHEADPAAIGSCERYESADIPPRLLHHYESRASWAIVSKQIDGMRCCWRCYIVP
jgi:hypothetical protein